MVSSNGEATKVTDHLKGKVILLQTTATSLLKDLLKATMEVAIPIINNIHHHNSSSTEPRLHNIKEAIRRRNITIKANTEDSIPQTKAILLLDSSSTRLNKAIRPREATQANLDTHLVKVQRVIEE